MDCDEQHEPEMIPAFLDLIREDRWDLISGSRYRTPREDDDQAPQDRATINAVITRLLSAIYPLELTDSFCGFKAHRVAAMGQLELTEPGYAFPLQLWPGVVKAGLRMTEMSVRRIYNDPKRTFGATLDQPLIRLRHYLDVLAIEHEKLFGERLELPDARELLSGTAQMPVRRAPVAVLATPMDTEAAGECCGCCCGE
jgi:dolichol-phosphate mannosyltransferase